MDQIINNIWLTWNLTCVLRTYNSIVIFSKYVAILICLVKIAVLTLKLQFSL